jgi:acetyl/propionyl-CoA carboxylase alpha subunit
VSQYYDALIAKVIAHAPTRAEAIAKMEAALARYILLGVTTNVPFLRAVLAHPEFQSGAATTQFVGEQFADWRPPAGTPPAEACVAAALAEMLSSDLAPTRAGAIPADEADPYSPWQRGDSFRAGT